MPAWLRERVGEGLGSGRHDKVGCGLDCPEVRPGLPESNAPTASKPRARRRAGQ